VKGLSGRGEICMRSELKISDENRVVDIKVTSKKMDIKMSDEKQKCTKNHFEEWKECRNSIARFDKIIIDIRKFGFSFVTGLLTTEGYLFFTMTEISNIEKIGFSFINFVLIFALYRIDRYHEIFLIGAVQRSIELEEKLKLGLTINIHKHIKSVKTDEWGSQLYIVFGFATGFPPLTAILSQDILDQQSNIYYIIFLVFLTSVYVYILWLHDKITRIKIKLPLSDFEKKVLDLIKKNGLKEQELFKLARNNKISSREFVYIIDKLKLFYNVKYVKCVNHEKKYIKQEEEDLFFPF
jgi:hypothetical protein